MYKSNIDVEKDIILRMPNLLAEAVVGLKALHNTPDELAIPLTLAYAALGAQVKHNMDVGYGDFPLSLYFLVLSDSGTRKTSNNDEFARHIHEYETDTWTRYKEELTDYQMEHENWKAEKKQAIKKGETFTVEEPIHPIDPVQLTTTATWNGIMNQLQYSPAIGLFTCEGAQVFEGHSFSEKNGKREEITSNFNALFSGANVDKLTGVEQIRLSNRRAGVLILIQPDQAIVWSDSKLHSQGFFPRFCVTQTPSSNGSIAHNTNAVGCDQKSLVKYKMCISRFMQQVIKHLDQAVDNSNRNKLHDGRHLKEPCELYLRALNISRDAEEVYNNFGGDIDEIYRNDYLREEHDPHIKRLQQIAARIAGVLTTYTDNKIVEEEEMTCAVNITKWLFEQRCKIEVDHTKSDPIVEDGENLLRWLKKHKIESISVRDLSQKGPSSYRKRKLNVKKDILDYLVSNHSVEYDYAENTETGRKVAQIKLP